MAQILIKPPITTSTSGYTISTEARNNLYHKYFKLIKHNPALDRTLVSFQANKHVPFYSWFKYKEGFSQRLVVYLLEQLWHQPPGVLLDPFAGVGTTLFAAREHGWQTKGMEVLPVGIYAVQARLSAARLNINIFDKIIAELTTLDFEKYYDQDYAVDHIAITKGAFPEVEERQLVGFIAYCRRHIENKELQNLLLFTAFSILEDISYTRKDGQYLRWDYRSGRSQGKKSFDKGPIRSFREAFNEKLGQILSDLRGDIKQHQMFEETSQIIQPGLEPELFEGSCLERLPMLKSDSIDFVLTSPPYVNRYDYTRTYALELVFLGRNHEDVKRLRQAMLSCTVENKNKREQLRQFYLSIGRLSHFELIDRTFEQQEALQEVLGILDRYRNEGKLNNNSIARLVRNYFYEMCFVIFELSRVLRPGGIVVMVNDNVRYAGEEVPVDLILSDIAETFGLVTRNIWTVGSGKGNSSQQMGNHGRSELRKCVYIWQKS